MHRSIIWSKLLLAFCRKKVTKKSFDGSGRRNSPTVLCFRIFPGDISMKDAREFERFGYIWVYLGVFLSDSTQTLLRVYKTF